MGIKRTVVHPIIDYKVSQKRLTVVKTMKGSKCSGIILCCLRVTRQSKNIRDLNKGKAFYSTLQGFIGFDNTFLKQLSI